MSVLVVLGLIWAAVLIPPAMRARAERRAEFIESFRQQMGALGAKAGRVAQMDAARGGGHRRPVSPMKRRRDILGGLLGAMIASLLLGAIPSLRMVWVLHLFLLNAFIAYVALLAHQRRLALRRRRPVLAVSAASRGAKAAPALRSGSRPVVEPALSHGLQASRR
jgi:uncharacterized membrane protein